MLQIGGGINLAVIGVLAFFGVVFFYYYFFERPRRAIVERRKTSHYDEQGVILKTKPQTFQFYNEKLQRLLLLWVLPTSGAVLAPRIFLPFPISIIVTGAAAIILMMVVVLVSMKLTDAERAAVQGNAFAPALVHYTEYEDVNQLFRNMKFEGAVHMSQSERGRVVDKVVADVQNLEFYIRNKDDIDIEEMKKRLLERIKDMRVLRYLGDEDYRILYITETSPEDLKTPNTVDMVHRTVNVTVPLMPFWGFFGGTTARLLKSVNTKGAITYITRRLGIFLDVFNLEKRNELLATGQFTKPDKMTMLLGEYLHLFEQQTPTSDAMNKTMRRIERRDLEAMKAEFENTAETNRLVNATKHLLETLSELLRPKVRTKTDYVLIVLAYLLGAATWAVIF